MPKTLYQVFSHSPKPRARFYISIKLKQLWLLYTFRPVFPRIQKKNLPPPSNGSRTLFTRLIFSFRHLSRGMAQKFFFCCCRPLILAYIFGCCRNNSIISFGLASNSFQTFSVLWALWALSKQCGKYCRLLDWARSLRGTSNGTFCQSSRTQ